MPGVGENPWWHPRADDADWDELPEVIELSPEYSADLPLWGECGAITWQRTKFSPQLLDRLAAWQQDFDANFHWDKGWRSAETRDPLGPPGRGTGCGRARRTRQPRQAHRASMATANQRLGMR